MSRYYMYSTSSVGSLVPIVTEYYHSEFVPNPIPEGHALLEITDPIEPTVIQGKYAVAQINLNTRQLEYTYKDIPLPQEAVALRTLQTENSNLKNQVAQMMLALVMNDLI